MDPDKVAGTTNGTELRIDTVHLTKVTVFPQSIHRHKIQATKRSTLQRPTQKQQKLSNEYQVRFFGIY
jgi:hypothetical protein